MLTTDPGRRTYRPGAGEALTGLAVAVVLGQGLLAPLATSAAIGTGVTIFVSILLQALPFLVLGVVLSGAIVAFVPSSFWQRAFPKRPAAAVGVAACSGAVLPGCECASVPVASSLMRRGVAPAAALAFLLSAPAINPVVMASTWVAFPNNPELVLARFLASLATSVVVGLLWLRFGRSDLLSLPRRLHSHEDAGRWAAFRGAAAHDFLHAGGFLVIGAFAAAVLNVAVPREWLLTMASNEALAILGLALLAVALSICSEADAFVAASLTQFSLTARLAFLVVGPMVDLKLIALQAGTFGRSFALRFAPLTFAVGLALSTVVGVVLL